MLPFVVCMLVCQFTVASEDTGYRNEQDLIIGNFIAGPSTPMYLDRVTKEPFSGWVIRKNSKFFSIFRVIDGTMDGEYLAYKKIKDVYKLIFYQHYLLGYLRADCRFDYSTGDFISVQLYATLGLFNNQQNLDSKNISYCEKKKTFMIMEVYHLPKKNGSGVRVKFAKLESNDLLDSTFYHAYADKPYYFPRVINDVADLPPPPKDYIEFGNGLFVKGFVGPILIATGATSGNSAH